MSVHRWLAEQPDGAWVDMLTGDPVRVSLHTTEPELPHGAVMDDTVFAYRACQPALYRLALRAMFAVTRRFGFGRLPRAAYRAVHLASYATWKPTWRADWDTGDHEGHALGWTREGATRAALRARY